MLALECLGWPSMSLSLSHLLDSILPSAIDDLEL